MDAPVEFRVRPHRRVPGLAGNEVLAQRGRRVHVAAAHEIPGTVCPRRHHRQVGRVFDHLDLHRHADPLEVARQERRQLQPHRVADRNLHPEGEAVGVARLGNQAARLVGLVLEQFLDRRRHRLQRLVVALEGGVLGIGEQFRVAAEEQVDDLPLVDRQVHRPPYSPVAERLLVDPHDHEGAAGGQPTRPAEFRGRLLHVVDGDPADVLEDVQLARPQRGQAGRLVLDRPVDEPVDERDLVALAADRGPVPVVRAADVGLRVAGDEPLQREGPGAGDVPPVLGIDLGQFPGHDAREVAVAEAVVPLRVELPELEDDRVVVPGHDAVDVVEVGRDRLRAVALALETEHDVVGVEFPRLHHAGFVRERHAAPHFDDQGQRVFPLPARGHFAPDRLRGQVGLGDESLVAAADRGLVEIGDEELLVEHPRVVVLLPVPVRRVPGQRRQGDVDRADVQLAAVPGRLDRRRARLE